MVATVPEGQVDVANTALHRHHRGSPLVRVVTKPAHNGQASTKRPRFGNPSSHSLMRRAARARRPSSVNTCNVSTPSVITDSDRVRNVAAPWVVTDRPRTATAEAFWTFQWLRSTSPVTGSTSS